MELAPTGCQAESRQFRLYADVLKQGVPPYHPKSRSLVLKHTRVPLQRNNHGAYVVGVQLRVPSKLPAARSGPKKKCMHNLEK